MNGNVGIGTPSPAAALHVIQTTANQLFFGEAFANPAYMHMRRANGTFASPTDVANGDNVGGFQMQAFSSGGYSNIAAIKGEIDGTYTSGQRPPSRLVFYTNIANTVPTEMMRITGNGNVGIGIAAPTSRIHGVTTLSAATGDEVAYQLNYTVNKLTSGNSTGLLINMTETSAPGTDYILELQRNGVRYFSINSGGYGYIAGGLSVGCGVATNDIYTLANDTTLLLQQFRDFTTSDNAIEMVPGTFSGAGVTQNAVVIKPTYNQTTTSSATDLLINRTQTAVGSGAQLLIDAQVGGVSKFKVDNGGRVDITGLIYAGGGFAGSTLFSSPSTNTFSIYGRTNNTTAGDAIALVTSVAPWTNTSGQSNAVKIIPTYNQTSGDAANTDLLINRTQTAVGSGAQLLIDAQVGGVSKFSIDNVGNINNTGSFQQNIAIGSGNSLFLYGTGQILNANATLQLQSTNFAVTDNMIEMAYGIFSGADKTQAAVVIKPTYNTSGTSSATDLLINRTQTAVGSGAQLLIDAQVGGASKFKVDNAGTLSAETTIQSNWGYFSTTNHNTTMILSVGRNFSVSDNAIEMVTGVLYGAGVAQNAVVIKPTYNQTTTSSATDLLINRTETAVGSGAQLLIDAQVGGVSQFSVSNTGAATIAGTVTLSSVGAMDANDTYVCRDPTSGVLTTGATCTASSLRYKKNIAAMSGGLNQIMQLRPVTFDWKYNNRPGLGFIAEEVEQINPVLVTYDDEGNVSGLHYDWMSAILTKAVQELASSASEQQAAIAEISNSEFLISNQIPNLNDQVSGLVLKTGENISTIKELQKSVDEELAKISNSSSILADRQILISNKIQNINDQNTNINEILKQVQYDNIAQDNLIAALQAQMDELKKLANQELNLAQIDLNANDISFIKTLLGVDRVKNPGDIDILGKMTAQITETGALAIKIIDKDSPTIGEAAIQAGETSIEVKTKAADKDSKIYITPVGSTKNEVIYLDKINDGKGFEVRIDNAIEGDIKFNWWIVKSH